MSILVTGDIHLSENPRDAYRFKFLDWLLEQVKKRNVDHLIILGDITDNKDRHDAWLTNEIAHYIHSLAKIVPVTILTGNHDYLIADLPFFEFLGRIDNVLWITKPREAGRGDCLFLPHTRNYKKDWPNWLEYKTHDWIFTHQTFQGANVGSRTLDGIPLSVFPKGSRVISGDIHVPQTIGPVTYVGAPYHVNFGDDYEGRVLLIDGDKLTSIKYNGPQKRLVEIQHGYDISRDEQALNKGDIIKVRVKLASDEYDRWATIRSEIKEWADKQGYILETIQPIVDRAAPKSYKKIDAVSDTELVKTYAKRANLSKQTLSTGLKILET